MDRRWLWVALFASLALNLFVIGGLVGAGFSGMRLRPPPPTGMRGPMGYAVRTLPPDRQAAWRAGNPGYSQTYGPKLHEARRLTREAMGRMADEPFARDAILADLKQARALEFEGRNGMDQRLVDFAATLPPSERADFARALSRPPMRGDLRRRGPGPDGSRGGGLDGR